MNENLPAKIEHAGALALPNIVTRVGERTAKRFLEFFTVNIRDENTRAAYAHVVSLNFIEPMERA